MALWRVEQDPFSNMERSMSRLFDNFLTDIRPFRETSELSSFVPRVEVSDDGQSYKVHCELPGCRKEDISLDVHDNALMIQGETKQKRDVNKDNVKFSERRYGKWTRSIALPQRVDKNKVSAKFEDGILEVVLPRTEEEQKRRITIS